jgi:hypothetical protein
LKNQTCRRNIQFSSVQSSLLHEAIQKLLRLTIQKLLRLAILKLLRLIILKRIFFPRFWPSPDEIPQKLKHLRISLVFRKSIINTKMWPTTRKLVRKCPFLSESTYFRQLSGRCAGKKLSFQTLFMSEQSTRRITKSSSYC